MKFKKVGAETTQFVEKRERALHRYISRVAAHPVLRKDESLRIFLTTEDKVGLTFGVPSVRKASRLYTWLPERKKASTSGAYCCSCTSPLCPVKLPKPKSSLLEAVKDKIATFDEPDMWFLDKAREVDTLQAQLAKLHNVADTLVSQRRELASATTGFAESFAALAEAEEVAPLTKAMHQLADVEAKVAKLHKKQVC
jgi:sorting nexin-1/2